MKAYEKLVFDKIKEVFESNLQKQLEAQKEEMWKTFERLDKSTQDVFREFIEKL